MESNKFQTLTPQEREELALCGITSPLALSKVTEAQLIRDIGHARHFFPEKTFTLTKERIHLLFDAAEASPEPAPADPGNDLCIKTQRHSAPTTKYRGHAHPHKSEKKNKKKSDTPTLHHSPVRCIRPFFTLLSAICTLSLFIPLASSVVIPILLITDNMPYIPIERLVAMLVVIPCLLYVVTAAYATCPVCHIRIFRFAHYSRNRDAHYLPLLGYNFATALHILFFWRYNCPGCGTPVKFFGAKGRRTHR